MVLLFYVDDCLIFSTSKDKIDELYAYLQEYFKIEYYGEINKYLGKELDRRPDGSIHLSQPYITQGILNMISGKDKLSNNPKPSVKPLLEKSRKLKKKKKT